MSGDSLTRAMALTGIALSMIGGMKGYLKLRRQKKQREVENTRKSATIN